MRLYLAFGSSCAAFLAVAALSPAYAAAWNYGTRVGLSSDWNDNPALEYDTDPFTGEPRDPEGTFRFLAAYDGEFERRDYDTLLTLRPRVTTDYYPDSKFSKLQTTNYFLPGSFTLQRPTRSWSLGFNASQQSVLSSEESTSQGIVLLESDDTLTQLSLSPSLRWLLSERDELLINLSYSQSDYDLDFTSRTDSTSIGANLSYSRSLNERNTVGITAFLNTSDADRKTRVPILVILPTDPPTIIIDRIEDGEVNIDSTSSFFTVDYGYSLSETSSLRMSYGLQDATTESVTTLDSTGEIYTNPFGDPLGELSLGSTTYNVAYFSEGPRAKYSIGASRSVTLDITTGQPQDRDELNFDGEYKITERLVGGWGATVWQQQSVQLLALDENTPSTTIQNKPKYLDAEVRLSYNLTTKWYLTGRYEYRWRSQDQVLGDRSRSLTAVSNNITIGITYLWKDMPR